MIRIDLEARRPRWRMAAWSVFVIALGLGFLHLVDRQYPLAGGWRHVVALGQRIEVADRTEDAERDSRGVDEVGDPSGASLPPDRLREPVTADGVRPGSATAPRAQVSAPDSGPPMVRQEGAPNQSRPGPRQSRAAPQALRLCQRLPRGARMTSLSCQAGGEYSLAGLAPPGSDADLFSLLDTLEGLPSDVSLSFWREGRTEAERWTTFTFEGRLPGVAGDLLRPLEAARAASLLGQVEPRAHALGLDAVSVEPPTVLGLGPGLARHRQKCWATGTRIDLLAFVASLAELDDMISVGEIVVVPTRGGQSASPSADGRAADRLRFYAAVDVVVADDVAAVVD